ncbi:MAG: two-component sensor histidine kinase [Novosphingobium sp.]|nr:two-component sensor histidine kinase [Novosphingobium sp.]
MGWRTFPLASGLLALAAAIAMALAGANPWLVLAVLVLWLGSLWLAVPEPEIAAPKVDAAEASRDAVRETIEALGGPVLLLDQARIVMANGAARAALGSHIVGQDARIALRHPDAMRLLDMEDGASVSIPGFTGGRSLWQLVRRRIDADRWLIELTDRTSESDVGRAHTDFVANASHELRTPLAAIIGYVETLEDGGPAVDAAASKRFLGIIEREAKRMLSLVEDLMTLSHVEAEKHDRPSEDIDLGRLAARVVGEVSSLRGKERVELGDCLADVRIAGDAGQLEQLLRNLIDNALKYGAPDQPVRVGLHDAERGRVVLSIVDKGPGIAAEHLPHLTRRFYRTDPGRSRASGGTGLGLAIVKHIVERHGGQLDIASEVGEGTSVSVTLPRRTDEPE